MHFNLNEQHGTAEREREKEQVAAAKQERRKFGHGTCSFRQQGIGGVTMHPNNAQQFLRGSKKENSAG